MFSKVTWLTVMVLLILPEKDMANAQNSDLTSTESRVSFKINNSENNVKHDSILNNEGI